MTPHSTRQRTGAGTGRYSPDQDPLRMRDMLDKNGRRIEYLRISITDRCNLRCVYCMPESGVSSIEHAQILSFEEITRLVRIMTGLGIKHIRLTGGEPMARRGCLDLVQSLSAVPGVESISMTSNGILLKDKVHQAKLAGLSALNISIDALNPSVYSRLTRGGDVSQALCTLRQAVEEGLHVKVNTVPIRGFNEEELTPIAHLAKEAPICVRFIELMPIGYGAQAERIPYAEVVQQLREAFGAPVEDGQTYGHGPARYVRYPDFKGAVGFISAVSHEFCASCNRVRLTADGRLKLCLNHTKGIDLRAMLRQGAEDREILDTVRSAIADKPGRHAFYESIRDHEVRSMNAIGG